MKFGHGPTPKKPAIKSIHQAPWPTTASQPLSQSERGASERSDASGVCPGRTGGDGVSPANGGNGEAKGGPINATIPPRYQLTPVPKPTNPPPLSKPPAEP